MRLVKKAWPVIELVGLGWCITYTINQAIIFYLGYTNPLKYCVVYVDKFGEGGVEAVLYIVVLVVAIVAWSRLVWRQAARRG